MDMQLRALFGRIVWRDDITNNILNQHHRGFWIQAHTVSVRTQLGCTRFQSARLIPC